MLSPPTHGEVTRLPAEQSADKPPPQRANISFSVERILAPDFGEDRSEEPPRDPKPPVWIYCSRFSARPTAGPRRRNSSNVCEERNRGSRTAFTARQVSRLRAEFQRGEYLSDTGRRDLAVELGLTEAQVKIWFQNARAKRRRSSGGRQSPLAKKLAEAGLYNHSSATATSHSGHASS